MAVGPDILCARYRSGAAMLCGVLKGGTIFEQIGQNLGGDDVSQEGRKTYVNLVARFSGRWFCVSRSSVYVYDPDNQRWWFSLESRGRGFPAASSPATDGTWYGLHSGLFVGNSGGSSRALWFSYAGDAFAFRYQFLAWDPDGNGGSGAWAGPYGSPGGTSGQDLAAKQLFFKGQVYSRQWGGSQLGDGNRFSLSGSVASSDEATVVGHPSFFSLDDRIFLIGPPISAGSGFSNGNNVEEFTFGAWVARNGDGWTHNFVAASAGSGATTGAGTVGVLRLGNAVYVFGGGNNLNGTNADSGLMCIKITIPTPGGITVKADITDPVIPAVLRPQVGGGASDARTANLSVFLDDQTDPANPVGYVMWSPVPPGSTQPSTLFRFNGEGSVMTQIGVVQGDSRFAYPDWQIGVGPYAFAPPSSTPLLEGDLVSTGVPSSSGVQLNYRVAGDPMLLSFADNNVLLPHGVVTAGPFVVGETITGADTGSTATVAAVNANNLEVTLDFVDGAEGFRSAEVITGGTSGASAFLNIVFEPPYSGGPFVVNDVISFRAGGGSATVVTVNAADLEVNAVGNNYAGSRNITGSISGTDAVVYERFAGAAGRLLLGETVTGGTSGATGVIRKVNNTSVQISQTTGTFTAGETVTGGTSGATRVLSTIVLLGLVNNGPFVIGETVTGGTSGATGVVTRARENWNGYGTYVALTSIAGGPFVLGEEITGGTSAATATLTSGELPSLRGAAIHTARFRYHLGSGPTGIGAPSSPGGICTLVAGTALGGATVVNGNDVENVVADQGTLYSVEWDFLSNGVPQTQITDVKVEVVRG